MTEARRTFIIPNGYVAIQDADGRATGEIVSYRLAAAAPAMLEALKVLSEAWRACENDPDGNLDCAGGVNREEIWAAARAAIAKAEGRS